MIELAISEYFATQTGITDRVGTRIYPGRAPRSTTGETIILQEIVSQPVYGIDLECGQHDKLIQIDCYAISPRNAYTLAETVRTAMSGYQGTIGTTSPIAVQSCRILSSGQETEQPADSSDQWIHRYRMDFALFAAASIPSFS